jgi:hypothetical protein
MTSQKIFHPHPDPLPSRERVAKENPPVKGVRGRGDQTKLHPHLIPLPSRERVENECLLVKGEEIKIRSVQPVSF